MPVLGFLAVKMRVLLFPSTLEQSRRGAGMCSGLEIMVQSSLVCRVHPYLDRNPEAIRPGD